MTEETVPHFGLGRYAAAVGDRISGLEDDRFVSRLWAKDASLWTDDPEGQAVISNALGWLNLTEKMVAARDELADFATGLRQAGFRHVVYMGMGGSSLCPLVFQRSFNTGADGLPLTVLDTTDPATVLAIDHSVPLEETLFIIASKSGTTAEPLAFGEYFYGRLREMKGDAAGGNLAVVTDPGTPLVGMARERGYRQVFLNFPDIGGRFSALSYFGLVPATLMGVDVAGLLARASRMTEACRAPAPENPGVVLGAVMGELALRGRDKVTLVVPPAVATLGAWLEQLMAESTGKQGKGLIPVAAEPLGSPEEYGDDRLFVHTRIRGEEDGATGDRLADLEAAGQPLVTIDMDSPLDLGREFYRWEIATATAGAILGINAFNQPNVQESKDNTNRLLEVVSRQGRLPGEKPTLVEPPLSFYAAGTAVSATELLSGFLGESRPGDYIAILAYLTEDGATDSALERLRLLLRRRYRVATTAGYGPRYLHSTGQLHKGGPDTGLFLQLTVDDSVDADITGSPYGFSVFRSAQARGDLEALRGHGRRALRIHLGNDAAAGLAALEETLERTGRPAAPGQ